MSTGHDIAPRVSSLSSCLQHSPSSLPALLELWLSPARL